jgi:hypothetical protein
LLSVRLVPGYTDEMASVGEKITSNIAKALFGDAKQSRGIPAAKSDVLEWSRHRGSQ